MIVLYAEAGLRVVIGCIALHDNVSYSFGMQRQVTVRLPDDLSRALQSASERMQRRPSEIVRLALREFLGSFDRRTRHADRVQSLIGSLQSGIPDLAEKHRAYIIKALRRGR